MLFGSMATSMATQPALPGLTQLGLSTPGVAVAAGVSAKRHVTAWHAPDEPNATRARSMGSRLFIARGSGRVAAAQAIGEGRFGFGMATPSIAILQTKARSGALPGRNPPECELPHIGPGRFRLNCIARYRAGTVISLP